MGYERPGSLVRFRLFFYLEDIKNRRKPRTVVKMKMWLRIQIAKLGEYINSHESKIAEDVYYFLCSLVYGEN